MAVLIVEFEGLRRGAKLPRRVLIGRRSMNHLVINHRLVSRMHAWIDGDGERYFLTDTGTRTGTSVNGRAVVSRQQLSDGDEISIGPAKLTFLARDDVPADAAAFIIPDDPPAPGDDEKGVLFACACGAPMWAGLDYAGHQGQCRYCGRSLKVPWPDQNGSGPAGAIPFAPEPPRRAKAAPPRKPRAPRRRDLPVRLAPEVEARRAAAEERADALLAPAAAPAAVVDETRTDTATCGVCQSSIAAFEERTACPSCGLSFHAECWGENYGCSAYGCSHVNALAPAEEPVETHTGSQAADSAEPPGTTDGAGGGARSGQVPWEFVLLAASVFAALLGALTFGVPSLLVAGGSAAYMARIRHKSGGRSGIVLLSAGLGVLGVITGVAVSYLIYFGRGLQQ